MPFMTDSEIAAKKLFDAFSGFRRIFLNRNIHTDLSCGGLTHSEMMLLFRLSDLEADYPDGISVSKMSGIMYVKPPSITSLITGLEQKNMIERCMDKKDRRIVRIRLTDAGQRIIEENMRHMLLNIKGLADYLGKEKSELFAGLLSEACLYFINAQKTLKASRKI